MKKKILFLVFAFVFIFSSAVEAHPGRTDSNGGHTCRTNCESWGLEYGEYHYHNGGGSVPDTNTNTYIAPIIQATNTPIPRVPTATPTIAPSPTPYVLTDLDKKRMYRVVRVVDGDTFDIDFRGKTERVRLLAIDTPESVDPRKPVQCFSKEATKKLEELSLNKYVRLVYDKAQGDRDKYQRFLRYAYDGKLFINREMVVKGYAFSYKSYPTKYLKEFNKLEANARDKNLGLWSSICNY